MADDLPPDPVTPMLEMAATFREFYGSLLETGFSDWHATYLTGQMIHGLAQRGSP